MFSALGTLFNSSFSSSKSDDIVVSPVLESSVSFSKHVDTKSLEGVKAVIGFLLKRLKICTPYGM